MSNQPSLRTAPCPRCQALVVFGERQCRSCAMPFDYGANPPPEPSAAVVFDVLMSVELPPQAAIMPRPSSGPVTVAQPASAAANDTMPRLDTGRQAPVGDVATEDIPGFVDSTLFAAWTPPNADVATMPGLEVTRQAEVQVHTTMLAGIDSTPVPVGDVVTQAVPGLFGSDVFRTDVDVAAGASASPSLDVTINSRPARPTPALLRVSCPSCATMHAQSRCPSCGTAAPSAH